MFDRLGVDGSRAVSYGYSSILAGKEGDCGFRSGKISPGERGIHVEPS
jgi:hypothetical protein